MIPGTSFSLQTIDTLQKRTKVQYSDSQQTMVFDMKNMENNQPQKDDTLSELIMAGESSVGRLEQHRTQRRL